MRSDKVEVAGKLIYEAPKVVEVGKIIALTGSGGDKIVDSHDKNGNATNWNLFNSAAPEILGADVLD
jgi:hypothetical protein